ncbi:CDGSH iron-sulfur domain-containing protein [Candidatus Marsarchaeota archaeon]|jgi:CDGSH-type Zn-finger protein|nr:CDGSH iron-sulfur domain-containing protein [Candidatus Marsarchaeota archaeon]
MTEIEVKSVDGKAIAVIDGKEVQIVKEMVMKSTKDGPNLLIIDGQVKFHFCRCGHSEHKPQCDGTHKKVGFIAEEKETKVLG